MRNSKAIWKKAIRDIRTERAGVFSLIFLYSLIKSVRPFVYVIAPAWIVRVLLNGSRPYILARICILGVTSHTILTFFEKVLFEKIIETRDRFNLLERNKIIQKLFNIPYEVLESGHCSLLISRQKEDMELHGGIYNRIIAFAEESMTYGFSFVISLFLLMPFFLSLSRYGAGFWIERPLIILISLIILTLSSVLLSRQRIKVHRINEKEYEKYSEIYQEFEYYRDIISNYKYGKAIRIFGLDEFIINKGTRKLLSEGISLNEEIAVREAKVETLATLTYATFNAYFWLLVAAKTITGELALSSALVYIGAISEIMQAIQSLFALRGDYAKNLTKLNILYDILNLKDCKKALFKKNVGRLKEIEVKNLSYAYDSHKSFALRNISLALQEGEKLAIVGENGSGKTTFVKILCGLLKAGSNQVWINGESLETMNREDYQSKIAVVFQDFSVFSLPIAENVACTTQFDTSKVEACLIKSGFHDHPPLARYVYKDCHQDGIELSGGEAQKLAISRALYRDAELYIFDEPTASLDPRAEYEIYRKFFEMTLDKTAIYVSHRLSACKFCDRIAVFDQGRLIQIGTHEELVNKKGKYAEMWTAQAKYFN